MTPLVWQVTPLGRPWRAEQVAEQFAAQTYANKKLCVVVSGNEWEARDPKQFFTKQRPDLLLQVPVGKGAALNKALEVIPRGSLVLVRDDDDWHLPGGMEEMVGLSASWDIVGQRRHWVWMDEELWLFNQNRHSDAEEGYLWGGNFLFRSEGVEFDETNDLGECCEWLERMQAQGATRWNKSPNHSVMVRGEPWHLWSACNEMVQFMCSDEPAIRYPEYDPDLVVGKTEREGEIVHPPSQQQAESAQIQQLTAVAMGVRRKAVEEIGHGRNAVTG